jgi:NADPH-dependent 2,4-dienoyl-CoA reductase/sulfur reductase-like enzyme
MQSIVVVGASLAGLSAARALRAAGFEGRVLVVGEEKHEPYDRPPLSKDFLAGRQQAADLSLAIPSDADHNLEWRLGETATALRAGSGGGYWIELASGESLQADGVVIATGARARTLPGSSGLRGVHTLRTLDDALALRAELVPGARLVVVGGGFIGAEIAATARELDVTVTLVELAPTALAGPLGEELGAVFAALHVTRGVEVLAGVGVAALTSDPDGQKVTGVRLADDRELAADVVLVGIGSIPNTEWLAGAGLIGAGPEGALSGGVLVDESGRTNLPGVVATGDCAAMPSRFAGRVVRHEHWTNALQHPGLAVAALLGTLPPRQPATAGVPYFWSDQYGLKLQFAGHYHPGDEVEIVEGDVAVHSFVAVYRREGRPVAVLGVGRPKVFGRWRKQLATEATAATEATVPTVPTESTT